MTIRDVLSLFRYHLSDLPENYEPADCDDSWDTGAFIVTVSLVIILGLLSRR